MADWIFLKGMALTKRPLMRNFFCLLLSPNLNKLLKKNSRVVGDLRDAMTLIWRHCNEALENVYTILFVKLQITRLILGLLPASERRRYIVTTSLSLAVHKPRISSNVPQFVAGRQTPWLTAHTENNFPHLVCKMSSIRSIRACSNFSLMIHSWSTPNLLTPTSPISVLRVEYWIHNMGF